MLPAFRSFSAALIAGVMTIGPLLGQVGAHEYKAGALEIDHPWSRATPAGAKTGAGYTTIVNTGAAPDRLVAATAEAAARVSLHSMSMDGDVMRMRPLPDGLVVPANGKVALKPGGLHLMFEDLKRPLKAGESIPGTLVFEKAGTVPVSFKVEAIGTTDPHAGMKMD